MAVGFGYEVGIRTDGTRIVSENSTNYFGECNVLDWGNIKAISAGYCHTVGLREDNTVVATGLNENGECKVRYWSGISAIAAGARHTVGLRAGGTVVATGSDEYGQCNVSDWKDIKQPKTE